MLCSLQFPAIAELINEKQILRKHGADTVFKHFSINDFADQQQPGVQAMLTKATARARCDAVLDKIQGAQAKAEFRSQSCGFASAWLRVIFNGDARLALQNSHMKILACLHMGRAPDDVFERAGVEEGQCLACINCDPVEGYGSVNKSVMYMLDDMDAARHQTHMCTSKRGGGQNGGRNERHTTIKRTLFKLLKNAAAKASTTISEVVNEPEIVSRNYATLLRKEGAAQQEQVVGIGVDDRKRREEEDAVEAELEESTWKQKRGRKEHGVYGDLAVSYTGPEDKVDVIDVVITAPNTDSQAALRKSAASVSDATNEWAWRDKVKKYNSKVTLRSGARLVPAAFETSGRAHARFLQWLEQFYTKCFDEDEALRYAELGKARQVLSVALMRAIAQQHEDTMRQNEDMSFYRVAQRPPAAASVQLNVVASSAGGRMRRSTE